MIGLLAPLLLQGAGLDLTTSVDRSRVGVGEVVTYTLRAIGRSTAAFRAELPPLDGFAIVDRRERTDIVPAQREIIRAFTLELELRAEQVGTWTIGAVRVDQGASTALSNAETITVTSASALSTGLEADLLALIGSVPAPRYGVPSVFVVPSATELYAGDQLNVLTAAWLPRGLRLRLRQPPTLSPPALPGVWSTPRTSVPGAVASRSLEGELYDLFVGFQTVYPLNPGILTIPAARLSWTEPGGRLSGDDRRRVTESGEVRIGVNALPDAGRPAGYAGPVGRGVRIEYRLGQGAARAGVVMPVDILLSGTGNLALWPTPEVAWPAAARVYEEESEITPRLLGQRVGGTRRFRFTVVPDSAGSLPLPPLEYAYFDPGTSRYQTARATGIVVPVLEPLPVSDRRSPVPLWLSREPSPVERVLALDRRLLVAIAVVPLLVIAATALIRRRKPRHAGATSPPDPAAQLEQLVHRLVPRKSLGDMEAELRRAGLDRRQAEQLTRLHRAVEAEVYSRLGKGRPGTELIREIEGAIRAVPKGIRRAGGLAMLLGAFGGSELLAQPAMTLYARREYAAAAEAFRREPESPRRWYNVAASEYMARRDAHAVAALLGARAAAPRDARVRGLWAALAREHEQLRRTERITPLSAGEAYVAALLLVWLGAILFVLLPRQRTPAVVVVLLAAAAAGGGFMMQRDRGQPRAVLAGGASLRVSPHGLAPERGTAPAFSIVRLERRAGPWWLVATDAGSRGWVPAEILATAPR